MAGHGEVTLRRRICRRTECRAEFWICSRCDRGQCYCSPACRRHAWLDQHRRANRRYRNSPEARYDHRQRQRAYRRRRSQNTMPDHTSISPVLPPLSDCGPGALPVVTLDRALPQRLPVLCCRICGRTGRVVRTARSQGRMQCVIRRMVDSC